MTYATAVQDLIDEEHVLAYHPMTDASGSGTAADASGLGGVGLTINGFCSLGNTGGPVSGLSTYLKTVSATGGELACFRGGITAGSGVDLLSELTYLVFCRLDSAPSSGTPEFFGRKGLNMGVRMLTTRKLQLGSGFSPIPSNERSLPQSFAIPVGVWFMLALTYSVKSGQCLMWVNGQDVEGHAIGGNRTGTTNAYGVGGNGLSASWSGLLALNFAASRQLQTDLYEESGINTKPAVVGVQLPDPSFGDAGATLSTDGLNGGKVNPLKDGYLEEGNFRYRWDQYGRGGRRARAFAQVGDTARDIAVQAANVAEQLAHRRLLPVLAAKQDYWSGDGINAAPAAWGRAVMALAQTFATIHKFRGLAPSRSYPLEMCKMLMDWMVLRQGRYTDGTEMWVGYRADGAYGGSDAAGAFFTVSKWADVLLMVRNHIPATTYDSWLDALDGQFTSVDGTTAYGDGFRPAGEHFYYVNGNYEVAAAVGRYKRWMLDNLSPLSPHKAAFESQWGVLTEAQDPHSPSSVVGSDVGPALAAGYGLRYSGSPHGAPTYPSNGITSVAVTGIAPTRDDGADGVGWLTERQKVAQPGLDWDYASQVQLPELVELHEASGDIEHLKVLNVVLNACLPRIGTGQAGVGGANANPWYIDCNGGSRHGLNNDGSGVQLVQAFDVPAIEYIRYHGLEAGRDLSGYNLSDHFRQVRVGAQNNNGNVSVVTYYSLAQVVAAYARVDPSWDQYA
jgi:hypothetical protein